MEKSLDALARDGRAGSNARLIVTALFGALLVYNLGFAVGLTWLLIAVAGECLVRLAGGRFVSRADPAPFDLVAYAGVLLATNLIWTTAAMLYWTSGEAAFQFVGVCVLAGLIIHAQGFAAKSRLLHVIFLAPPLLAIFAAPTLFGAYPPAHVFTALVSLLLLTAYLARDLRQAVADAAMLKQTQSELEVQTARAIAANEAKSRFLALISHELRTPLNGVMGMARALESSRLSKDQVRNVAILRQSSDGLLTILDDLLDLSKLEAGKFQVEMRAISPTEICAAACELWGETARAKGLTLTFEAEGSFPALVSGDPVRLRQIVSNLVSNAMKFTAAGGVSVTLRPEPGARAGQYAISVADTGIGMSEAQRDRLFEAYAQAEASTSREYGGTGLGLSICRQLCELMGGEITVTSTPGEGSEFTVVLPLVIDSAAPPVMERHATGIPAAEPLEGLRVLVVDDNAVNLMVASAVVGGLGAAATTAGEGLQALELLKSAPFDLVLMDIHMPGLDGVETVRRIRGGGYGDAAIIVVALTADADADEISRLMASGFDGVATKPIQPTELLSRIQSALSHSIARDLPEVSADRKAALHGGVH